MATPRSSIRKLPSAVIALGLTSFFADVGADMVYPLLPVFIASIGGGAAFLGLVEGLADATSSLLKLASGYAADRVPRRKPLVVFGYGLAVVARPVIAIATAPWHVLVVRVADRVGKGVRSAPRDVLIADSVSKEDAGRAFGFHRALDHAGAVVGPLVATALLALGWPLRSVFWAALVPGVLSVLAVLAVREPSRPKTPAQDPNEGGAPRRLTGRFRSYLWILLLFSIGNSSDAFLLLRARELGVPVASLPILWAVLHVAKVVTTYLGGHLSDRFSRPKLIVSGWLVFAATYFGLGAATHAWHAWAIFVVYGAHFGLTEPAEKALVRDLAPAEARGRAYGAYNFVVGLSAIPAGLLTGWIWQAWSPYAALATGACIVSAASAALLVWARRSLSA